MILSLNTQRLSRYKDILRVLLRHSNKDLLKIAELNHNIFKDDSLDDDIDGDPEALSDDLQSLGPTFIKLGQSLSMRPDLLPEPYQRALSRLQDNIDPFSSAEVEHILEQELGTKINNVFSEFNEEPLAAASLGQVHKAHLHSGRTVVVKVQRPGIQEQIIADLNDIETVAGLLEQYTDWANHIGLSQLFSTFKQALLKELNYKQEAFNLNKLKKSLSNYPHIRIPEAVNDLTTERVLVMDYIQGVPVSSISGIARTETDTTLLAKELFEAYLDQVLVHGFVHADPHPGNILLADNKLALLDLGMVAHVAPAIRVQLIKLLLALSDGRGKDVADICLSLGTPVGEYQREEIIQQVTQQVNEFQHSAEASHQLGNIVLKLTHIAMQNSIRPAAELSLLGKTLLYLDEISQLLDPTFDPKPVVQKHVASVLKQQLKTSLRPGKIMDNILDLQHLGENLPKQANRILDQLANNELRINVKSFNEAHLLQTLEKIANRIAAGLILAGLIIGAALLMPIKTPATIWGYPALAIILFLAAVILGFMLVISILIRDRHKGKS